jgi:hypothetical protein
MRRQYLLGAVACALASSMLAKRTSDYVAPTYSVRLFHSVVALSCFAVPILVLLALGTYLSNSNDRASKFIRVVSPLLLLIVVGAAVAATDGLNDEGWNPALYGSIFVAALLPLGFWRVMPRDHPYRDLVTGGSAFIAVLVACGIAGFGIEFCHWASARGWPVSW